MKTELWLFVARGVTYVALLMAVCATAQCGMDAYFIHRIGGVQMHMPPSAESVSRSASKFQDGSTAAGGMFEIVKKQHGDMQLMYSRLEAEARTRYARAVAGFVIGLVISALLVAALVLMPKRKGTN